MEIQQKNLTILFRTIQPETLHQNIQRHEGWDVRTGDLIASDVFQRAAHSQYPTYSYEEIANVYLRMQTDMREAAAETGAAPSVLHLLVGAGKQMLRQSDTGVLCRFSQMLAWQEVYQSLGQDI